MSDSAADRVKYYTEITDCNIFTLILQIFKGNSAKIYRISHYLRPNSDFYASAVRIYPLKWHGNIALRVELYGC